MPPPTSHTLIAGLGISGYHAARLAAREGHVTVIDGGLGPRTKMWADELRAAGVDVQLACGHLPDCRADLAVISPGIPASHPWGARPSPPAAFPARASWHLLPPESRRPSWRSPEQTERPPQSRCSRTSCARRGSARSRRGNIGRSLSELALTGEQWDVIVVEGFLLSAGTGRPLPAASGRAAQCHLGPS